VLVGIPDSALYQARDRCKAAVSNSGQEWPISLLTINLSPATLPKAGSHYDLSNFAKVLTWSALQVAGYSYEHIRGASGADRPRGRPADR
jgi:magnesium chelatase family protein